MVHVYGPPITIRVENLVAQIATAILAVEQFLPGCVRQLVLAVQAIRCGPLTSRRPAGLRVVLVLLTSMSPVIRLANLRIIPVDLPDSTVPSTRTPIRAGGTRTLPMLTANATGRTRGAPTHTSPSRAAACSRRSATRSINSMSSPKHPMPTLQSSHANPRTHLPHVRSPGQQE